MAHAISNPTRSRLDGGRIAAEVGTIAVNAALLLLLLVPLSAPLHLDAPEREPTVDWVPRVKPKPVPPIAVPVVQPRPRPTPPDAAVQTRRVDTPTRPEVLDAVGEIEVPRLDERAEETITEHDGGGETIGADSKAVAGGYLQYAAAPPPLYPREAIRDRLTGTVLLRVLVDVDGMPLEVTVQRSSGHRVLDQAARRQVLGRWKFVPARRDGLAVQAIGLVPVDFALQR